AGAPCGSHRSASPPHRSAARLCSSADGNPSPEGQGQGQRGCGGDIDRLVNPPHGVVPYPVSLGRRRHALHLLGVLDHDVTHGPHHLATHLHHLRHHLRIHGLSAAHHAAAHHRMAAHHLSAHLHHRHRPSH